MTLLARIQAERAAPELRLAAHAALARLASGGALAPAALSALMTETHGGSDAAGLWRWRDAYDVAEAAAAALFLREAGAAPDHDARLALAREVAALLPVQSKRSEGQLRLQQFSTPLPPGLVAAAALGLRAGELVLEPSCGTGLLAAAARACGGRLVLNELDPARAALARFATGVEVSTLDAEFVDDLLDPAIRPNLVLMNPPFSASAARAADPAVAGRHLVSALKRLGPGGRLVAIMPPGFRGDGSRRDGWREACARARPLLALTLPTSAFRAHGVSMETLLCVFEKTERAPALDVRRAASLEEALAIVEALPTRRPTGRPEAERPVAPRPRRAPARATLAKPSPIESLFQVRREPAEPLVYEAREAADARPEGGLYAGYRVARISIPGAAEHPTPLVESAAMAAIRPPLPTHRPNLPPSLVRRGVLSDAQIETVVYAGEAFAQDLPGAFLVDEEWRSRTPVAEEDPRGVRFRRGFFLGDGTGCGKGRQVAGIILDAFARGARRAVWVSKSDKLIEDAARDWTALGQDASDIRPLSRWKLGEPIDLAEGVLFVTYATLRTGPRQGKAGRLEQIVAWLGEGFEGVIAFDEAHAMGGAAPLKSDRGRAKESLQGAAGLRLQLALPRARVLYVSATGATTIENLAYAERLGLWGEGDYPFPSREAFVTAMVAGGVAAMEIVARDLKALGLYAARALSFDGVEYEILQHALKPEETRIYDAYADAFQLIHRNLDRAMEATGLTREGVTQDAGARAAARSRFESLKQRFFNHLLTAMKTPALLRAIEARLAAGFSVVIQIVSTGEALMDRRLDALSEAEREDLSLDLTPREYVVEYLREAFPTELRRSCEDEDGNLYTEIVRDEEGRAVESREAVALREAMIEELCLLAPVQTALDQIVWRFGAEAVAEATGRTRRVVRIARPDGADRLKVERRAASANAAETRAFMAGDKRILVFSEAGGTGRSYHADLAAKNRERRVHFLLEAGWRADNAVQGLGRTHRSNQASAPIFIPVTTDVKGETRFISTISRRLDSLGALTKGAAKTGGQNLFRPEDNLESRFAKSALRAFYAAIVSGDARSIGLDEFTATTGLALVGEDGALLEDLPPITRFLNRILALRIARQNAIFEEFQEIVAGRLAEAEALGLLEGGVETLRADGVRVLERRTIRTCPATGAETLAWRLAVSTRIPRPSAEEALARWPEGAPVVNARSGSVALRTPYASLYDDDGRVTPQLRLVRPRGREVLTAGAYAESAWEDCAPDRFAALWTAAVAALPETESEGLAMVSGLVLPVWKALPDGDLRIRRVTTDCGLTLIGRLLRPEELQGVAGALGALDLSDAAAIARAVMSENRVVPLVQGARLKRRLVGARQRCEIETPPPELVRALKAAGCFVELISYRARVFVKLDQSLDPAGVEALRAALKLLPPLVDAGGADLASV